MSREEILSLNGYLEDLYQAMQIGDIVFESKRSSELYNLINKLLKENQELKKKINTYENPEDLTLMFMYCDEKAKDKIKCLEQENQQLKKQLERSEKARKEAIKYVKKTSGYNNPYNDTFLNTYAVDNLLEILDIDKGE